MKMKSIYLSFAIFAFTLLSCNKEENEKKSLGTVEFSFSAASLKSSLKSTSAETVATAVVITVEDLNGKKLYNNEKVDLYSMNGYYISKPVSLVPGGYKLTKFMVVDASNKVLYLTPMENSPKAYLVKDPLPIGFAVSKDNVTKVVPEVISSKNSKPEDFGYATFSFDKVETFDFLIGVFAYNESIQNFEMTTAHLSVAADSGWVYGRDVPAATDTITVKDNQSSYIITVTKEGYNTWTDTLTANELKLYLSSEDNGPLEVILSKLNTKKISFTTNQDTLKQVNVRLKVFQKVDLKVNWGDGTTESIENSSGVKDFILSHSYNKEGAYLVTIYGSVENILDVEAIACRIISVDVKMAKNLNLITVSSNYNLKFLDLSDLHNLQAISCSFTNLDSLNINNTEKIIFLQCRNSKVKRIDISQKLILTSLDLSYNPLDVSEVNKIVEDLLLSVKANPRTGTIFITTKPTGNGQVAMEELINQYGWSFKM